MNDSAHPNFFKHTARTPDLEILFENEHLIAVNKPHGLLVHRSKMAADAQVFALQQLRDQIGQKIFPCHRLDRKTSGVLLFAKSGSINALVQELFRDRKVDKWYLALVRGFVPDQGTIDYPLTSGSKVQDAYTQFSLIEKFVAPWPSSQFRTSRYSLVRLKPLTGRFHQLRKHMAHIFHPIIGDRPHGCNKQNKVWKDRFGMTTMLLHAECLKFELPDFGELTINADTSPELKKAIALLKMDGNSPT